MECRYVFIVFNHLVIVRTEANRRVEWITSDGGAFHFPGLTICWLVSHLYLCWIDGWWSVSITQRHTATVKLNVSRRQNIFIASHSLALFELGVEFVRIRCAWIVSVFVYSGRIRNGFLWMIASKIEKCLNSRGFCLVCHIWRIMFVGEIEGVDELKIALCLRNPPSDECPCLQLPAGHGVYWWQCLSVGLRLNVLAFVGGTGNGKEESIFSTWCSCNLNNDPRIVKFSIAVTYFIDKFSNRWEIPLGK